MSFYCILWSIIIILMLNLKKDQLLNWLPIPTFKKGWLGLLFRTKSQSIKKKEHKEQPFSKNDSVWLFRNRWIRIFCFFFIYLFHLHKYQKWIFYASLRNAIMEVNIYLMRLCLLLNKILHYLNKLKMNLKCNVTLYFWVYIFLYAFSQEF